MPDIPGWMIIALALAAAAEVLLLSGWYRARRRAARWRARYVRRRNRP